LFNRRFRDRDKGLAQLSPSLRSKAKSVLEATEQLRANNGSIRDPERLCKLADSATTELTNAKLGDPALATDSKPSASDGSFFLLLVIAMVGTVLLVGDCGGRSGLKAGSFHPKVHYRDPRPVD
jgi:hypothetical protein